MTGKLSILLDFLRSIANESVEDCLVWESETGYHCLVEDAIPVDKENPCPGCVAREHLRTI